jgi:hypothetical protein
MIGFGVWLIAASVVILMRASHAPGVPDTATLASPVPWPFILAGSHPSTLICSGSSSSTRTVTSGSGGRDTLVPMTEPRDLPKAIGAPATRALAAAGYTSIDQLAGADSAKLAALHGVGPKALRVIAETLADRGLAALLPFGSA